MVVAVGLSSYNIALFHLVNHAFYKALLFLGAGSVIHAVADNQDFRKYGGLVNYLPLTYSVMLIASLSLAAFPFMTGFYSKDFILESAYGQFSLSGITVYIIATIGAIFTTLYSVKVLYLTFLTRPNGSRKYVATAHEGNIYMTLPLVVLAIFSIFWGFITKDLFIGLGSNFFGDNSLFIHPIHEIMIDTEFALPTLFKLLPFIFTIFFSFTALTFSEFLPELIIYFKASPLGYNIWGFFNQRFLVELIYNKYISNMVLELGGQTTKILDKGSIELMGPFGLEKGLTNLSKGFNSLNTSIVTNYALYIFIPFVLNISILGLTLYFSLTYNILLLLLILVGLAIWSKAKDNLFYSNFKSAIILKYTICLGCVVYTTGTVSSIDLLEFLPLPAAAGLPNLSELFIGDGRPIPTFSPMVGKISSSASNLYIHMQQQQQQGFTAGVTNGPLGHNFIPVEHSTYYVYNIFSSNTHLWVAILCGAGGLLSLFSSIINTGFNFFNLIFKSIWDLIRNLADSITQGSSNNNSSNNGSYNNKKRTANQAGLSNYNSHSSAAAAGGNDGDDPDPNDYKKEFSRKSVVARYRGVKRAIADLHRHHYYILTLLHHLQHRFANQPTGSLDFTLEDLWEDRSPGSGLSFHVSENLSYDSITQMYRALFYSLASTPQSDGSTIYSINLENEDQVANVLDRLQIISDEFTRFLGFYLVDYNVEADIQLIGDFYDSYIMDGEVLELNFSEDFELSDLVDPLAEFYGYSDNDYEWLRREC